MGPCTARAHSHPGLMRGIGLWITHCSVATAVFIAWRLPPSTMAMTQQGCNTVRATARLSRYGLMAYAQESLGCECGGFDETQWCTQLIWTMHCA